MNSPEGASFFTYVNLQFDSNCRDFKISCLQVDCKMLFCQNCDDMASQAPQMLQHLNEQGTPIMMGSLAVLAVFFASLLFLKFWEKYVGPLGMARSFIWFVSFMQVSSVKVPYHHVSNKGQHDGETCWRCISFLVHFLFVFASATNWIYVQDEWMFGRSSPMLGVNPRRECSFGIGAQCDWEVLEIMPILWWAYALIPHLERWDEKQQGELVFSAWNINSSCESCSAYVFVTQRLLDIIICLWLCLSLNI